MNSIQDFIRRNSIAILLALSILLFVLPFAEVDFNHNLFEYIDVSTVATDSEKNGDRTNNHDTSTTCSSIEARLGSSPVSALENDLYTKNRDGNERNSRNELTPDELKIMYNIDANNCTLDYIFSETRLTARYDKIKQLKAKIQFQQEEMLDELYMRSNGARYHVSSRERQESDGEKMPEVYETDDLNFRIWRNESWNFFEIPYEFLQKFYLNSELEAMIFQFNFRYDKQLGDICNKNKDKCTILYSDETKQIMELPHEPYEYPKRMKWIWYKPSHDAQSLTIMDAIDQLLIFYNKKKITHREPHLVFIGDSVSEFTYRAMLKLVERTLGAKLLYIKQFGYDDVKNTTNKIKWLLGPSQLIRYLLESKIKIYNFNDKSEIDVKLSFISHFKGIFFDKDHQNNAALLKMLCGIPFEVIKQDKTGKIPINSTKDDVDVVIFNYGPHYNYYETPLYLDMLASHFSVAQECKSNGVIVIFRESYAQHFRYNSRGDYDRFTYGVNLKDLEGRLIPVGDSCFGCAPQLIDYTYDPNWRFNVAAHASDRSKVPLHVVDQSAKTVCLDERNQRGIDVIPSFANSQFFWWGHNKYDCTHYMYTPGLFFPFIDSFYRILLKYNLDVDSCADVPQKSKYFQGPEGILKGCKNYPSLDLSYYPTFHLSLGTTYVHGFQDTLLRDAFNDDEPN